MAATHESGPSHDSQEDRRDESAEVAAADQQVQQQSSHEAPAAQSQTAEDNPSSEGALTTLQSSLGNAWVARRVKAMRKAQQGEADVASAAVPAAGEGGSGAPLGEDVQAKFGQALGADLSGVRVHTGGSAESAATQMNARAFTVGQDIYGPSSELNPGSAGGRETLAHEVIHTVQNQAGRVPEGQAQQLGVGVTAPGDSLEVEAERGAPVVASGGAFTVAGSGAPGVAARATADVTAALDAAAFSVDEVYRQITTCEATAGERATCYANNATMNKMRNKLNASQMLRALQLLNEPGLGGARLEQWIEHCRRAGGATRATYDGILAGQTPAHLDHLMGRPATIAVLQAAMGVDPITVFPHLRTGLNAAAAGSRSVINWLLATATSDQVFHVVKQATAADQTTAATNMNASATGWDWVDGLNGPNLTAGDRAVLTHMRPTADANGKGKIDAQLRTAGPPAPGQTFAQRLTDLQASGTATAAQARAALQTATAAERVTVLNDPAKVAWLNGLLTGNPMQEWGVPLADMPTFVAVDAFFLMILDRLPWAEALRALHRGTPAVAGARCDANVAEVTSWLATLPARNAMTGREWNALVGIYQTWTNAALKAVIDTYYGGSLFMNILKDATKTFADIKTGLTARVATAGWAAGAVAGTTAQQAEVMRLMAGRVNGDQMYELLGVLAAPAAGRPLAWMPHIQAASVSGAATGRTYQGLMSLATAADRQALLATPAYVTLLQTAAGMDALTLFPGLQAGLTAAAAGSAPFVQWMVASSTADQVLRAIIGSGAAERAAAAGHMNGVATGWNWVDGLNGPGLTAADRQVLASLNATANAAGQAKIAIAIGGVGAAAPAQTVLQQITALRTSGNAAAGPILTALQSGSAADRLAVLAVAAEATYVNTTCPGNPIQVWAVQDAEKAQFLANWTFMQRLIACVPATVTFADAIALFSDRGYITQLVGTITANVAAWVTWVGTWPARATVTPQTILDIRAIRLAVNNGTLSTPVWTYLGDSNPSATVTAAGPAPAATTRESPLVTLDRLLTQVAPAGREVLSMIGAMSQVDKARVAADATRMTNIRTRLTNAECYSAYVALELTLVDFMTQLGLKGASPQHVQSAISRAPAAQVTALLANDAAMRIVQAQVPQQPLHVLGFGTGALPATLLNGTVARDWILGSLDASSILTRFAGTDALAATWTPIFDAAAAAGWSWMSRLPDGHALLADEVAALRRLRARTTFDNRTQWQRFIDGILGRQGNSTQQDIDGRTGNTTDRQATPAAAMTALTTELAGGANADRLLRLVTQVTTPADRTTLSTTHRAALIGALSNAQVARAVQSLGLTLTQQLDWLRQKGGTTPATLQMVIDRSPVAQRHPVLSNANATTLCQTTSLLGPMATLPGMTPQLAALAAIQRFWAWVVARQTALDMLALLQQSAAFNAAAGAMIAAQLNHLDGLPRGTALVAADRAKIDAIMPTITHQGMMQKLFAARWDLQLTGPWAGAGPADLLRCHNQFKTLPIAHLTNNTALAILNRHNNGGGTYDSTNSQINIGANTTDQKTLYDGTPQRYQETYFDHTVRHEVGHAVDRMLGERTSIVYTTYGWKKYNLYSHAEQWINRFGGWQPTGGGAAPNNAQKTQIRNALIEFVQSGGGTIAGPSHMPAAVLPTNHAWHSFQHIKLIQAINNTSGMKYTNRHTSGSRVYSINFYYRHFMEAKTTAANAAPRDYTMFAPEEWFADMYAEFYRLFDGNNDALLGGNCPADVKAWFLANVHRIGGRTPHDLRNAPPAANTRASSG